MKKNKPTDLWNEHFFRKNIRFVDKPWLIEKLSHADPSENQKEKNKLQIGHQYTLYKNMFGVMIETGNFEIRKILMKNALDLMKRFVKIIPKRKTIEFYPVQNLQGLIQTAEEFGLELPDKNAVQGYALNHELVFFETAPYSSIIIKYKDKPENIFLLYHFYFSFLQEELFLILEKNF